jgi:hypothetical protein
VEENLVKNLDNKFKTSLEKMYNIKDIKITWKHNGMNYEFSLGIRVFQIMLNIKNHYRMKKGKKKII